MAYDQCLGDRINQILQSKNLNYYDKKMMGGLVFMVNNKMCSGIHIDKSHLNAKFYGSIFAQNLVLT